MPTEAGEKQLSTIRAAPGTPLAVQELLQYIATIPRLIESSRSVDESDDDRNTVLFEVQPGHPIAKALLSDGRMESVWRRLGDWPGSLDLMRVVIRYSDPLLLANFMPAPKDRTAFGFAPSLLSDIAKDFIFALESFSCIATELWGEPTDPLVERLRAFAEAASRKADEAKDFYNFVLKPSGRGRGDRHQLAFRDAIASGLKKLITHYGGRFSLEDQDDIVATLASVVFPHREVDPQSVKRHRERRERKLRAAGRPV